MPIRVIVTKDFDHMSEVAADLVKKDIIRTLKSKEGYTFGLATGSSPTGVYKRLARAANDGEFDSTRIRSFNLDEYVGLPGQNPQERMMHPESYGYFMIQEFFGLLRRKFLETSLPWGSLIDQKRLLAELKSYPEDWRELGRDRGRQIRIKPATESQYLGWIRKEILGAYAKSIKKAGGIDLQIVGVGGRGHVGFHESGIPFAGSRVMLVRLDDNTVANAVADRHFSSEKESPRYAVTMGAELIYQARKVLLLACGERKVEPVAESLLGDPTPDVPISYGQLYSQKGGNLVYVLDEIAARELLASQKILRKKGVKLSLLCSEPASGP